MSFNQSLTHQRRWRPRLAAWAASILSLLAITIISVFIYFGLTEPADVHASLNGRIGFSGNPATNGGQSCTTCHAQALDTPIEGLPTISITGPSTVEAGSTNLYTVLIEGGPSAVAGANIASSTGGDTLAPVDTDLQAIVNELTHSAPKPFVDGGVEFSFAWTAPSYNETVTLYAAGNSANGDGDLTGDASATTTLAIAVTGGGSPPALTSTPAPPEVRLEDIANGLNQPTDIQNAGDVRLFIAEKQGTIRIYLEELLNTPYLDITDRVASSGGNAETGLLGLAFHPNYAENGYFYVNYTVSNPLRTRVSRFTVSTRSDLPAGSPSNLNIADPNSELPILEFTQPATNHNGGQLQFGPDGYLYISTGDGGSQGDPNDLGQNNGSPLGKILRIDVDNTPTYTGGVGLANPPDCSLLVPAEGEALPYTIPNGNPLTDGAGGSCDEIWASGLRNPWRFSFDQLTGDQWIADVGQNRFEEINFAARGEAGKDYGWRCYEAATPYNTAQCSDANAYDAPLHWYGRSNGDCSITGGYVYRGQDYPSLNGHYFFSDFCNSTLRSISGAPDTAIVNAWSPTSAGSNIATFGEDVFGELYVGFLSGHIARLTGPTAPTLPTGAPTSTPETTPQTPEATSTAMATPTAALTETSTPTQTAEAVTATPSPTATDEGTTTLPPFTATPAPTSTPTSTPDVPAIHIGNPAMDASEEALVVPIQVWNIPATTPLGALSLEITFDPAALKVISCEGDPNQLTDAFLCNDSAGPGRIRLSALSGAGIDTNHDIAIIKVQPLALERPTTTLAFAKLEPVDIHGRAVQMAGNTTTIDLMCLFGDVDCSGSVDIEDVRAVAKYAVGTIEGRASKAPLDSAIYLPSCDANKDGRCTPFDGMMIFRCIQESALGDEASTEQAPRNGAKPSWCQE